MGEAALTQAMGAALGLELDRATLDDFFGGLDPILTEWSLNPADDPRGQLRFGSWVHPGSAALSALVKRLGGPACAELASRAPHDDDDLEGVGLGFRAGARPSFRWWQLSRPGHGERLFDVAQSLASADADRAALDDLATCCGGPRRMCALGVESDGGALVRHTVYFSVLSAWTAVRVVERIGALPTDPARRFFRELLGVGDDDDKRRWPKVWIGRSVGRGGGWKFYWFARGAAVRPSDDALLDLVEAGPGARAAFAAFRSEAAASPAVQLVGLTFRDGASAAAAPSWTLYLASR
ncbi:MAG: hypothetical protein Tsb0020_53380 [Haliangiales bacterium]